MSCSAAGFVSHIIHGSTEQTLYPDCCFKGFVALFTLDPSEYEFFVFVRKILSMTLVFSGLSRAVKSIKNFFNKMNIRRRVPIQFFCFKYNVRNEMVFFLERWVVSFLLSDFLLLDKRMVLCYNC